MKLKPLTIEPSTEGWAYRVTVGKKVVACTTSFAAAFAVARIFCP